MTQISHIPILLPLVIGAITTLGTIGIHALPLSVTVGAVRREKRLGRAGRGFWIDTAIVARALFYALVAHLLEIALWALVFLACGEFSLETIGAS